MNEKKRVMSFELRAMSNRLRVIRNKSRGEDYSFLVSHFTLLMLTICLVLSACSAPSPATTGTPTPTTTFTSLRPTSTPTPPPSPAPTETATAIETATASSEWQTTSDGHILYNEKDLFNGLFTMNPENNGEYTKEYWEDIIRGLWNLNNISKNTAFLTQFPTDQSLVDYFNNGGRFVDNLWIPVQYPNSDQQYYNAAIMVPVEGPTDLSKIAIAIYKPTAEEMRNYKVAYHGSRFMSFNGYLGEVAIEKNKSNILVFTIRRDLLNDMSKIFYDGNSGKFLALSDQKTPQENLLAATQLLRIWTIQMQTRDNNAGRAWIDKWNPPGIKFWPLSVSAIVLEGATTLEGTPLAIR